MYFRKVVVLLFAVVWLTACGATTSVSTDRPAWMTVPFTNVKTGKSITLADYAGKTVVVEGMAAWCGTCFYQQTQAAQMMAQLKSDLVVYISLDIDPNEQEATLVEYANTNNFGWTFTKANKPLMEGLISQFGRNISNPDSMPIFFISPSGHVSQLYTGGHTAEQLISLVAQQSKA